MGRSVTCGSRITRRDFLSLAGMSAGALLLAGCGSSPSVGSGEPPRTERAVRTDRVRRYVFEAGPTKVEIGGIIAPTWGYNGGVPGPEIRVKEGDTLRVEVRDRLPEGTTIHWHGLPVPNAMDGVPGLTQPPVSPGEGFAYEFAVPTAGTYLYHPHVGLQLDRGLYGPLVVEPKEEKLSYDREYVLLLDDWLDGVSGRTPEGELEALRGSSGGGMGGMGGMMGGGTLEYPRYLINGRAADDPETLTVRRGERVRLRLINAAAETVFRFAVAGHKLTVTHADGQPVELVVVDAVRLGMGERYDVLLEAKDPGAWQVAAVPEGKNGLARAVLRYGGGAASSAPPEDFVPGELTRRLLSYADLEDANGASSGSDGLFGGPDRAHELVLSGDMGGYAWAIDGQLFPDADPLEVREGERVRFTLRNRSMMPHPMHLHGHFFRISNGTERGPIKDTAIVEPRMGELSFDFLADNPGEWFFHCHNAYHMETGMARVVSYGRR